MTGTARILAVSCAALALACGDPTLPRDLDAPIQTNKLAYELRENGDQVQTAEAIEMVFTNRSATPIYIGNCNGAFPVMLQKLEGASWLTIWSPDVTICSSKAIVIAPAGSLTTRVQPQGTYPDFHWNPQSETQIGHGTYRLIIRWVYSSVDGAGLVTGNQVPQDQRLSNRFRLSLD